MRYLICLVIIVCSFAWAESPITVAGNPKQLKRLAEAIQPGDKVILVRNNGAVIKGILKKQNATSIVVEVKTAGKVRQVKIKKTEIEEIRKVEN